jgi:hypothetical protein
LPVGRGGGTEQQFATAFPCEKLNFLGARVNTKNEKPRLVWSRGLLFFSRVRID